MCGTIPFPNYDVVQKYYVFRVYFKHTIKKIKASAGIEPATFRLLGERTAIYAKRPYNITLFNYALLLISLLINLY